MVVDHSHSANVVVLYVVMVGSHEDDVDDDAEGDEELGEWIEDDVGKELADLDPDGAAVPDAEHVGRVHALLDQHLLQLLALVLIIIVVVVLRKRRPKDVSKGAPASQYFGLMKTSVNKETRFVSCQLFLTVSRDLSA